MHYTIAAATAIAALVVGVLSLLMVMVLMVVVAILIRPICVLYRKGLFICMYLVMVMHYCHFCS